ncbi:MAG: UDP-glucose 4-epimerase GalE [Bacteroidales bacterium]|nr:UDP-glucose 4-epimerase GalE [Bacteroidales bacterium]MBN2698530.1 UDP-glucose 4-epimerase GalE [Bacteroidales bacterium]
MNRVLVTGGTGYIGSHTVVELMEKGFDVVIIDNLSNSQIEVLDGIAGITGKRPDFEQVDLRDKANTFNVFRKYPDIGSIIHFAAFKAVGESVEKPLEYYHNNINSLIYLLEAMNAFRVNNFVFSSSCTVYGEPDTLPVTENAPIKKASSPYGNTKQICEEILQDALIPNPDFKIISLRYFNPIGAHPSALIGELPVGVPNNLVPFITQTAIGLRDELRVFGNDYNTPDGYGIRDYINVVDLSRAHVIAIERLLENRQKQKFEIFNLGTGKGLSVLEIIQTFERITGKKLKYRVVDRRDGDVEQVYADPSYANNELGWKAEKTLEETLLSAWSWEKYIRSKYNAKG